MRTFFAVKDNGSSEEIGSFSISTGGICTMVGFYTKGFARDAPLTQVLSQLFVKEIQIKCIIHNLLTVADRKET
jgi:hypothetical protein